MKKTYRSFFCLLAVLLLSVSALPAASALFSERLFYYGTVEEIRRAADGTVDSKEELFDDTTGVLKKVSNYVISKLNPYLRYLF